MNADALRDQQRALEHAVSQAIERGAHALLVPGDLFDSDAADAGLLTFAIKAFDVSGCPPVFIAPGNHDPCSTTSPYWNPALLQARGFAWPAHVHVFDETTQQRHVDRETREAFAQRGVMLARQQSGGNQERHLFVVLHRFENRT